MAFRSTRAHPVPPMDTTDDVPTQSTPGETSVQGGRPIRVVPPTGSADLLPPPELGGFLQSLPGLVQAFQLQAQTQAALQAQLQQAMPAAAANLQRMADPARANGASLMERFRRMGPPVFKGESSPDISESWIRETEKIFRAIRCPEMDKVILATYTLQERADVWWTSTLRTVFAGREDISWEDFLAVF